MSIVKFSIITNGTGAALTTTANQYLSGDISSIEIYARIFAAADVGAGAGQTQHAGGCLLVSINAGFIVEASHAFYKKNGVWRKEATNLQSANNPYSTTALSRSADYKSLLIRDFAAHADGRIAADDHVIVQLKIGSKAAADLTIPLWNA